MVTQHTWAFAKEEIRLEFYVSFSDSIVLSKHQLIPSIPKTGRRKGEERQFQYFHHVTSHFMHAQLKVIARANYSETLAWNGPFIL